MLKGIVVGILLMLGLVGYGVIDTAQVEDAGLRVKSGINSAANWVKEQTEPSMTDKMVDRLSN